MMPLQRQSNHSKMVLYVLMMISLSWLLSTTTVHSSSSHNDTSSSSSEAFAQPWLWEVRQDSILLALPITALFLFCVLYMMYDLMRPTTPFHLSAKMRRTRLANWFVIVLGQMAEMAGFFSLFVLEAAPKKTLDQCGLTEKQVYITHAVCMFVRPISLIVFGILIDRFKKLKEGKYLLIFALIVQAVLNFGAGTAVALGEENSSHSSESGTHSTIAMFSFLGFSSETIQKTMSVMSSSNPLAQYASFWRSAKQPLIIFAYVGGSFFHGISEIVLLKLCAIWYRGTEERATIAGILNISYCFELIVAYITNAYLYKIFGSAHSLLYVSAMLLSIASLCSIFISTHVEPNVDFNYYMHVFNKQQEKIEQQELVTHKSLNLEQLMEKNAMNMMSVPSDRDIVSAFHNQAELDEDTHTIDEQKIERSAMANEFKFVDPLRHDMRIGMKRMLMSFDLWMYAISSIALGTGYYGSYTWFMNYVSNEFHVDPKSVTYIFLVVVISLSPGFAVLPSIILNKLFARRKFFGMALLSGILAVLYAAAKSASVFSNSIVVLILFAFLSSMFKFIGFGVTRYWSISLGGAAHCGLVTGILLSGFYIGNGIGLFMVRYTTPHYKKSLSYSISVVAIPLFAAACYFIVAFKNGLLSLVRKIKRVTQK